LPQIKPFGPTSNPDRRVTDATENRAPVPPRNQGFKRLVNDPGER
jgi:hypothetical protein